MQIYVYFLGLCLVFGYLMKFAFRYCRQWYATGLMFLVIMLFFDVMANMFAPGVRQFLVRQIMGLINRGGGYGW
jgi:hypothetical protein